MPGDGYELGNQKGLIDYLSTKGFNVKWLNLMEQVDDNLNYEDLESDKYCKYINENLPSDFYKFSIYGISKGCYWGTVYASLNPSRVEKLLLVEPTTMKPDLLKEYELTRNNDFIVEYYNNPAKITREDNTRTTLDAIISDHKKYIPKCPTTIIWTSRNNQNIPYSSEVIRLKKKYEAYLKNNGCPLKVVNVDGCHVLDQDPKNYPLIYKYL